MPRTHDDGAFAITIGGARACLTQNQAASGKIRAWDNFNQFVNRHHRIVDICQTRSDDFAQIVRRNVGRHADRDAASTVYQQVWKTRRQYQRLLTRTIIIRAEIDSVLIDIFEQRHGRLGQPRLGITHRRRHIGIHRPEIALTIDQHHAHRPVLRHSCQCHVNRTVAVRVIIAHDVADDLGRLAVGPTGDEAALLARK